MCREQELKLTSLDTAHRGAAGMRPLIPWCKKKIRPSEAGALVIMLLTYTVLALLVEEETLKKQKDMPAAAGLHHDTVSCSNQGDSEAFIKRRHLSYCSNAVCYFLQTSII